MLLNAHESKLELRVVSINELVRQVIELQQVSLAQEKINVALDLDPAWPMVHGDAGQLQQVLMNLTGNARQALDQTGRAALFEYAPSKLGRRGCCWRLPTMGREFLQEILGRILIHFLPPSPRVPARGWDWRSFWGSCANMEGTST